MQPLSPTFRSVTPSPRFFYNAACFMTQHQFAVNHEVAASAVLEIMHIGTTNPNIFQSSPEPRPPLGSGTGVSLSFPLLFKSNHISCSVFHLLSPRFRFIEIHSFYQFSGTSPARRSPFYDNSIDGIMQELRAFQNTVFIKNRGITPGKPENDTSYLQINHEKQIYLLLFCNLTVLFSTFQRIRLRCQQ